MRHRARWLAACLSLAALAVGITAEAVAAEGKPVDVSITGIEDELLDNVRAFLSIHEAAEGGLLARIDPRQQTDALSVAELRRRHAQAPGEIRDALAPFGYYRPRIDAALDEREQRWRARYRIDPGPRTVLTEVSVRVLGEGRDHPAVREVLEGIDVSPGDPLLHSRYEALKSRLYDAAYANGYLDAQWRTAEIRVAPDRSGADLRLELDTGPRFYFGNVTVEQDILDPRLVERFIPFDAGDPYDVGELLNLQLTLSDSDYFERVEIRAEPDAAGADQRIPVTVSTEPKKPQRYSVGVGYATDTGPRVSLGTTLRRLNRAGHRFHADLELSTISQSVAAAYEIPIANVATDTLRLTGTALQEEVGDADTERFALGVERNDGWRGFRRRVYIMAEREHFQFGSGQNRESNLLYPGIALERQRADDVQYPRRGYSVSMDLRGGVDSVISDTTFARLQLNARWVRGVGERNRLLVNAGAGGMYVDSFAELPPSQRFFTGGDRSVRGYAFEAIGPRNAADDVIGGEYMLLGSVEFERLLWRDYGAAVFVDAGDAFIDSPDVKVGAGVGLRWRSPVGMVRLDVAHPFDDPGTAVRIHISIGADV